MLYCILGVHFTEKNMELGGAVLKDREMAENVKPFTKHNEILLH